MIYPPSPEFISHLMQEARAEASLAASQGEVPVGAVIARGENIIGRGRNSTEASSTVIAHAEIHAINEASSAVRNWRLPECLMCVTLEPCTMCLGAIRLARIPLLVFGAGDSRQGAVGSLYDLSQDNRLGDPIRVIANVQKTECEQLLSDFFKKLRPKGGSE